MSELPTRWRPDSLRYRKLNPGTDLPAWFIDGIKSVDPHLHFVYHPYRVMYDDIINQYSGSQEDPRFTIDIEGSWGYVLTDNNGNPIPEHTWHCWRVHEHGWSHIFEVKYLNPEYLRQLIDRLGIQKVITERHGLKAYIRYLRDEREMLDAMDQAREAQMFNDVQGENQWFIDKAMENFERGITAPTRPQKETIMSGPWSNRSKTVRDITDEEGGLVVPE